MNSRVWKREVEELAIEFGCVLDDTNGKHYALKHPNGWTVYVSRTPSDGRVKQYVKSDLRRKSTGVWR